MENNGRIRTFCKDSEILGDLIIIVGIIK